MAGYLVLISVQVQIVFYTYKVGRKMMQKGQTFEYKYYIITMSEVSPQLYGPQ